MKIPVTVYEDISHWGLERVSNIEVTSKDMGLVWQEDKLYLVYKI